MIEKRTKIARNKSNSQDIISSLSYISIPTVIFRKYPLAVLESIVVYLKDERNLNFSEIAVLLNRDQRNIWTVYSRVKKKLEKNSLKPESENKILSSSHYLSIPTEIFRKYPLAVLESIVFYLKEEKNLSFSEIGILLDRDQRNIWTVYSRAQKKLNENR